MEIIYTAFDGTTFNDKEDCLDYEFKKRVWSICKHGRFFGGDGIEFDKEDFDPELVCYAFFENSSAIEEFNKLASDMGVPGIPTTYNTNHPLNFKYCEDGDPLEGFFQYCDIIAALEEKIEDLQKEQEEFLK